MPNKSSAISMLSLKLISSKYCLTWPESADNSVEYLITNQSSSSSSNCHLRAGLFPNEIFKHENVRFICTKHNEIFTLVQRYLSCSISFCVAPENSGGRLLANGTWTGMLSLFDTKEADFIPHSFSLIDSRSRLLADNFTMPYSHLLSILSCPLSLSPSPWSLFTVDSTIWTLITLCFLLYGIFLIHTPGFSHASTSQMSKFPVITQHFLQLFALLLGQGTVQLYPSAHTFAPFLLIWIFASLIIRQLCSQTITALLLTRETFTYDTFNQLIGVRLLLEEKSSTERLFRQHFPFLTSSVEPIASEVVSLKMLEKLILNPQRYVMILAREQALFTIQKFPRLSLHVSKTGHILNYGNYAIRKSLERENKLKLLRLFKHIHQFGISAKIRQSTVLKKFQFGRQAAVRLKENVRYLEKVQEEKDLIKSYSVLQFLEIFFCGMIISTFCWILEIVFHLSSTCLYLFKNRNTLY